VVAAAGVLRPVAFWPVGLLRPLRRRTAAPEAGADAELVARLRAGDEAAFAQVVAMYDRQLRRLARTFVRTDALADDVVGETWLAFLTGLEGFEGRSSLKTWLFRILVNRARTRAVREARQVPFASLGPADDEGGPSVDPSRFRDGAWSVPPESFDEAGPEGRLLAGELRERLNAVVEELPEQQRTVILLRDFAGLDGPEVADALGISEGNQRVILHRARSRVRARLEEYLQP
jgi:RNA polymerase sigma-70 factor (ECF subfamily)